MNNPEIKCIIIDDEPDILDRLEELLLKIPNVKLLGKESNPDNATNLILNKRPDLVFIDVEMPRLNGFDIIQNVRSNLFFPKFIFVTAYNQYAIRAIKKEAFDFLLKPVDIEELKETLNRFQQKRNNDLSIFDNKLNKKLSNREKEVLSLLLKGLTSKEIAKKLYLSKSTIDTHRRNILDKTGIKSTAELIALK